MIETLKWREGGVCDRGGGREGLVIEVERGTCEEGGTCDRGGGGRDL